MLFLGGGGGGGLEALRMKSIPYKLALFGWQGEPSKNITRQSLLLHTLAKFTENELRRTKRYPLQKFSWVFEFSWESHEILMRKWHSHENFPILMRISHELFCSWESHFSHENWKKKKKKKNCRTTRSDFSRSSKVCPKTPSLRLQTLTLGNNGFYRSTCAPRGDI